MVLATLVALSLPRLRLRAPERDMETNDSSLLVHLHSSPRRLALRLPLVAMGETQEERTSTALFDEDSSGEPRRNRRIDLCWHGEREDSHALQDAHYEAFDEHEERKLRRTINATVVMAVLGFASTVPGLIPPRLRRSL